MATIKDVALAAGVSVSTVSIVLNGRAEERKIPPRTRDRVLEAAGQLRYQPNLAARRLRSAGQSESLIGIFWAADTRTIVLTRFLQGLQLAVAQNPYNVSFVIRPFASGRLAQERSLRSLSSFNAAIVATLGQDDINHLERTPPPIPLILFNRQSENFSSVTLDNRRAGEMAAEQLLAKGASTIGMACHERSFLAMGLRREGFLAACRDRGVGGLEENVVYVEDTIAGGYAAGMEFLRRGHIPEGIYCDDDSIAYGLLNAFAQNGVRVPQDVRIAAIGMGPPDIARYSNPPLTVVNLPLEKMAEGCVLMLPQLLQGNRSPQRLRFECTLHARQSSL